MKNILFKFLLSVVFLFSVKMTNAQTTGMPLSGMDCNGVFHDLFADLDAGKVVLLHFFMPNCGACPPPAQKIQAMANKIMGTYPGMITGYALPFENTTTCGYTSSWVSSNGLSLYAPYDSGATQVAYYGGFGMPTVVLLAGSNHRIMFSTLSFSTSDTTLMRDSILAFLGTANGITDLPYSVSFISVYPNPASNEIVINLEIRESVQLAIEITDLSGKLVAILSDEKQAAGKVIKQFPVYTLANGNYFIRLNFEGRIITQRLTISH